MAEDTQVSRTSKALG
jgi:hypothetical protein